MQHDKYNQHCYMLYVKVVKVVTLRVLITRENIYILFLYEMVDGH